MFKHYKYDNCIIAESKFNADAIDRFISDSSAGRIYHGDFNWANIFQKMNMLGFTCKHRDGGIKITQLYCRSDDFSLFNGLLDSLVKIGGE